MRRFRIAEFLSTHDSYHVARTRIDSPAPAELHTHDFFELFSIDAGEGEHHVNGQVLSARPGAVVFMRPEDRHAFSGRQLVIANLAFRASTLQHLRTRYFGGEGSFYGLGESLPKTVGLDAQSQQWFVEQFDLLLQPHRNLLRLERFLMALFERLGLSDSIGAAGERRPEWLVHACAEISQPQYFKQGTRGLCQLACRCPEHVSRAVKKWMGKTPTDLVNDARMQYAAERLSGSPDSILTIASSCGFENLAHFYKVFQAHFSATPKQYRQRSRQLTGVPSPPGEGRRELS